MKALIRNPGETVTENDGIVGIDWNTGAPLTNDSWAGGPYILVNDYAAEDSGGNFTAIPTPVSEDPATEETVPDTVVIDGVTYTRAS